MAAPFPIGSSVILQTDDKDNQCNAKRGVVRTGLSASGTQEVQLLDTVSVKPATLKLVAVSDEPVLDYRGDEVIKSDFISPNVWAVVGSTLMQGVHSVMTGVEKTLSLPEGKIKIDTGGVTVYKPFGKIKGVVKINLKEATRAQELRVTLNVKRSPHVRYEPEEEVLNESHEISGCKVYPIVGEVPFELIVPCLPQTGLPYTPTVWVLRATLCSVGESIRNMQSPDHQVHVDDRVIRR
mmetsp:Transcript_41816/g.50147  ORF Transcript_41816/g.50147 Transcript_41816/m.50147 type:complete len:238 (-) Transcript_41816:202-915(-)